MEDMQNPPHPGKILLEDWLRPYRFNVAEFAARINMSRGTISQLINGRNSISLEMAFKIARVFNNSPRYWLNLQCQYDVYKASEHIDVDYIVPVDESRKLIIM